MDEITVALIAIALVLSAVFLPMAFFGGSTGVIYRQFSLTIISAMILSVLVALILSPALTATLLKQKRQDENGNAIEEGWLGRRFPKVAHFFSRASDRFNETFDKGTQKYQNSVRAVVDRKWLFLLIYVGVVALLAILFFRLPTGFLPTEDQGIGIVQFQLPPGATQNRTAAVQKQVESYFLKNESADISSAFSVSGIGGGGAPGGQNTGLGFVALKPWDERKGAENSADAITGRASAAFSNIRDAQVFALVPPGGSRAGPVGRLHDGASEHQRHEPREIRGGARQIARGGARRSHAGGCSPDRIARSADARGERRSAKARRAGAQPDQRERHAFRRVGRAICQRTSSIAGA